MAIIETITDYSRLYHDLKAMDRDNFSYEGAVALMEYLDELSNELGENIEYDPIAFCCDFAEYCPEEYESIADEYPNAPKLRDFEPEERDEFEEALIEWLNDQTIVIQFNGGIIIQAF